MGNTPIYGFPYPDPSDLVANYPALGQDLAEDVETVISGLGSGLNHINTTTFTTQSSVSIDNVFTSTYANYLISIVGSSTNDITVNARLRVGGVDASGSNYDTQRLQVQSSSVFAGASNSTLFNLMGAQGTDGIAGTINVYSPQLATPTRCINDGMDSRSTPRIDIYAGRHTLGTAYDGMTFLTSAGTMTGTIRIYGYENS